MYCEQTNGAPWYKNIYTIKSTNIINYILISSSFLLIYRFKMIIFIQLIVECRYILNTNYNVNIENAIEKSIEVDSI